VDSLDARIWSDRLSGADASSTRGARSDCFDSSDLTSVSMATTAWVDQQ
jgi:hypothetical protein